ncbi:MAG: hypothetical protein J7J06_02050 [Methanosarcinales archaeon]|nr:hypothetical protein [Methanosarcinales archaeon]
MPLLLRTCLEIITKRLDVCQRALWELSGDGTESLTNSGSGCDVVLCMGMMQEGKKRPKTMPDSD